MSRVLITGATGFLGAPLVSRCLADGHEVIGTYRRTPPPAGPATREIRWAYVDLIDGVAVERLLREARPDVVIHLAAQSSTAESWRNPERTYRDNVMAQVSLLEVCRSLDLAPMVVIAGSSDEYGMPCCQGGSIVEDHRLAPLTPYGVSKAAQDLMARQYFVSAHLPTCVFRPFLQIGPGRSDRFFSGAFARQVVAIEMGAQAPVIEVGNIELLRDMTDVRDVARACTLIMTHGAAGEAYNVSSGVARPVGDLLEAMVQVSGIQAEVRQKPIEHRSVEPDRLVGDSTKLRDLTGWKPEISFRESAHDMLEDWRDRYRAGRV